MASRREERGLARVPLTVAAPGSMVTHEVVILDAPSSGNIEGRLVVGVAMSTSRGATRSRLLGYGRLSRRAAALASPLLPLHVAHRPPAGLHPLLRIPGRGERKPS
jgi:hypothetical protein